jgi:hypothetical protein
MNTPRLNYLFFPRTPDDWRKVGDDYLLPQDYDSPSHGGLCRLARWVGLLDLVDRFRPSLLTTDDEYWWENPRFPKAREHRAFACYFIAAMLEDENA